MGGWKERREEKKRESERRGRKEKKREAINLSFQKEKLSHLKPGPLAGRVGRTSATRPWYLRCRFWFLKCEERGRVREKNPPKGRRERGDGEIVASDHSLFPSFAKAREQRLPLFSLCSCRERSCPGSVEEKRARESTCSARRGNKKLEGTKGLSQIGRRRRPFHHAPACCCCWPPAPLLLLLVTPRADSEQTSRRRRCAWRRSMIFSGEAPLNQKREKESARFAKRVSVL